MATLEQIKFTDPVTSEQLTRFQNNVALAVNAPRVTSTVASISANYRMTGNETTILVDASQLTAAMSILLPSPAALTAAVTIRITKAGKFSVSVRASDVASANSPQIDGANSIIIGSVRIVSDGKNFWTS